MAHNRIVQLEEGALRRLPNLVKIDVQSNRLKSFGWRVLANCTNAFMAASLNLSDNALATLDPAPPPSAVFVKWLDLSRNHLTEVAADFLAQLAPETLKKLLLSQNQLTTLSKGWLAGWNGAGGGRQSAGLQLLDVSRNRLAAVERGALDAAQRLQWLDLSHNRLEHVPAGWLGRLTRLRVLRLSWNRLRTLPKDCLEGTPLDTLDLGHNQLTQLPVAALAAVTATLVHLDVSHNHIEHLDAVTLGDVPNLITLKLAHNRLSHLSDNVFSYLSNLMVLDLVGGRLFFFLSFLPTCSPTCVLVPTSQLGHWLQK